MTPNAGGPLTAHEPKFPRCRNPYCEDGADCAECAATEVPEALRVPRAETCEEHLGNALQIIRAAKAERRQVTLEELAGVLRRINQALTEVGRLNI